MLMISRHRLGSTTALLGLVAATLLGAACDRGESPKTDARTGTNAVGANADAAARARAEQAAQVKTPMDQSNSAESIRITAEIRRAILDDKALSTNAHNCKVITDAGVVTLRGPVVSQAEKDSIGAKAKAVAGVSRVVNELEIRPS